jgi:hypothetical protein
MKQGGGFQQYAFLAQAAHRERERRLTISKIRITGQISELKFKLLALKPQAPIFKD